MKMLGISLVAIGILCLLLSAVLLVIYILFEHCKDHTGSIAATLTDRTHKSNVNVYGRNTVHGPLHITRTIKHLSKGIYEYTVGPKTYRIRHQSEANSLPHIISVVYLKRFPKIAYVKTAIDGSFFHIYAFTAAALGMIFLVGGLSILFF